MAGTASIESIPVSGIGTGSERLGLAGTRQSRRPNATPARTTPGRIELRNARSVCVRNVTPADEECLRQLHRSLSPESRYLRYFSPHTELSEVELRHLTHPDGRDHVSLLALDGDRPVGHALYDRIADTDEAELAVEVVDDWQGQGLGTELCKELAQRARTAGLRRLVAYVLPQNRKMREMLRELDFGKQSGFEQGVIAVHLDVESDVGGAAPGTRSLLRNARVAVVAVIGASLGLIGVALLVLPGPGWAFVAAGLSVLAAEFSWARRWLRRIKKEAERGLAWTRAEPKVQRSPNPRSTSGD